MLLMPSEAIVALGIYVLGLIVIPPIFGFFVAPRIWDDEDKIFFAVIVILWPLLAVTLVFIFTVMLLVIKPLGWMFKTMLNGGSKARKRYDEWRIERAKKALEKKQKEEEGVNDGEC